MNMNTSFLNSNVVITFYKSKYDALEQKSLEIHSFPRPDYLDDSHYEKDGKINDYNIRLNIILDYDLIDLNDKDNIVIIDIFTSQ